MVFYCYYDERAHQRFCPKVNLSLFFTPKFFTSEATLFYSNLTNQLISINNIGTIWIFCQIKVRKCYKQRINVVSKKFASFINNSFIIDYNLYIFDYKLYTLLIYLLDKRITRRNTNKFHIKCQKDSFREPLSFKIRSSLNIDYYIACKFYRQY